MENRLVRERIERRAPVEELVALRRHHQERESRGDEEDRIDAEPARRAENHQRAQDALHVSLLAKRRSREQDRGHGIGPADNR